VTWTTNVCLKQEEGTRKTFHSMALREWQRGGWEERGERCFNSKKDRNTNPGERRRESRKRKGEPYGGWLVMEGLTKGEGVDRLMFVCWEERYLEGGKGRSAG